MYLLPTVLREWAKCPAQGFQVLESEGLATVPACSVLEVSPYSACQGPELPDLFYQPSYLRPMRWQGPEATNLQPLWEPLASFSSEAH